MEKDPLTHCIIGAAIEVHRTLGPGLLESAYETCLRFELQQLNLQVKTQLPLPLFYKNVQLDCAYRLDLLIENKIIVEIKTVHKILDQHKAQLLSYLKLSKFKVGLLLNFNALTLKQGIHRIVL